MKRAFSAVDAILPKLRKLWIQGFGVHCNALWDILYRNDRKRGFHMIAAIAAIVATIATIATIAVAKYFQGRSSRDVKTSKMAS